MGYSGSRSERLRAAGVFARAEVHAFLRRPDIYLGLVVRSALSGRLARVALPETGDEKFAWRKFHDRDPRLAVFSDKLAAKEWVRRLALDVKIPETLWTGTNPDTRRLCRGLGEGARPACGGSAAASAADVHPASL